MWRIVMGWVLGLFASYAFAGEARSRLEAFANGLNTVTASFEQRSLDANGELQEQSSGTLAMHAPRQFRWEYVEPFPQLIVADGMNVWIYDQDLEQVTVRSQSTEEAQSPLTVLTDLSQLDRDFSVGEQVRADDVWLVLKSKAKEPPFKEVRIELGASGPTRMELLDLLGNTTEWRFQSWRRNPALAANAFEFTPPAGVEVVGEPLQEPQTVPLRD